MRLVITGILTIIIFILIAGLRQEKKGSDFSAVCVSYDSRIEYKLFPEELRLFLFPAGPDPYGIVIPLRLADK